MILSRVSSAYNILNYRLYSDTMFAVMARKQIYATKNRLMSNNVYINNPNQKLIGSGDEKDIDIDINSKIPLKFYYHLSGKSIILNKNNVCKKE